MAAQTERLLLIYLPGPAGFGYQIDLPIENKTRYYSVFKQTTTTTGRRVRAEFAFV